MMYSFRIEQAIRAASVLHKEHTRKGAAPYPYISHLFAVACIIADYTNDEDIIIAGLLHDALEETDYTPEEMQADFGPRVREIVEGITQPQVPRSVHTWYARKSAYIEMLENATQESLIVCAADTIHNVRSIIEEYQSNIHDYLADFGGSLEERLLFYKMKSDVMNKRLESHIVHEFNHVLDSYNEFVELAPQPL